MANGKYDPDKVLEVYNKARQRAQAERYTLERDWFRNVLFFIGIQWIIYSTHTRKWQPRRIAKWVPRPVTNKFAAIANTIMQVLSTKDPEVRARPGTNDPQDVAAANVADRNFDVLLKEMESERARSIAAAWLTLTGSVIFHPCYDKDLKHGTTFQQHLQCQACGETFAADKAGPPVAMPTSPVAPGAAPISTDMAAGPSGTGAVPMPLPVGAEPSFPSEQPQQSDMSCPKCGSPQVIPAVDEKGKQVGEEFPKGKMKLEVFSPFEFFADLEGRSMDDLQEILVRRRYPLDVIKARFNKPTLEADNNSNVGGAIGLNLLRAIAYAAGNAMYGTGIASGRNVGDDQTVTVDMLWKRPNEDFPQGLVAFYANETLLNDGDGTDEDFRDGIPYKDRDGNPIWPWHLVKFDEVPGRLFGKTPMDDVAPKQEQRNKLESLIQLIITRMASPQWLIAKGLGVTEITGEAGQLIEGNWAMNPNLKPERVPGENVPTSVIAWLEKIDKDMEELAGCITADTEIPCLDGKTRTMKELADNFPNGGMWVYGFDRDQKRIVPAEIKRAWKTKTDKCVRVIFKEGTYVDCTPDHPFLTWDMKYVEAQNLKEDDAIVPLILRNQPRDYVSVIQPTESRLEEVHRMVAHELFELGRDAGRSLHVHHKDECKSNNLPENLKVMTPGDHMKVSDPKGWRKNPDNHNPELQSRRSFKRWSKILPEQRSNAVNAMLEARMKQLSNSTSEQLSASAKRGWETRRSNHRVDKVIELPGTFDVYDLTTSVHNFGTAAGVFVHNTFEVLRGSAPTGVTAGTALRLLLERATTRFTPAIRRLEVGWEHICKDAICIFQQFGTEERIAKIQGQGNTWEIEQFTNSDLNGSIDVIVEAGSALPKSTVGEQALIQDLTTGGVINPQDPNTQYKILEKFGSTNLLGDTDLNIKYAQRENWRFINEGKNPEIDPVLDSHPIHVMIHKQFALSSDFEVMSDQQRNVLRSHILQHQMAAIAMASPQAALPPNPNAPGGTMDPNAQAGPPGAPGGSNGKQPASKQESSEPPLSPGV